MKRMFFVLLVMTFVFIGSVFSVGCGGGEGLNIGNPSHTTQVLLRTTVQYGSIKYLSKYPEHLEQAKMLVTEVETALDEDVSVTLNRLETIVTGYIDWESMEPESKLLLITLLSEIQYQVQQRIGEGVLDEEDKVLARTVLGWVKMAFVMVPGGTASFDIIRFNEWVKGGSLIVKEG